MSQQYQSEIHGNDSAVARQREYYSKTASEYDASHLSEYEHEYAVSQLIGILSYFRLESLLDVGAGTGRLLRNTQNKLQGVKLMGIEPVAELREVGHANGVPKNQLVDGDALDLPFADNSWDIVSAFGILHHLPEPEKAIAEMCRVAKHGVFFSDLNNFGCGGRSQKIFAWSLRSLGFWRTFQLLKNGGKHEKYSEGDGIHYSYSLFDSLPTIRQKFAQTHLTNTRGSADNLFKGCSHISVFATKSEKALASLNSQLSDC